MENDLLRQSNLDVFLKVSIITLRVLLIVAFLYIFWPHARVSADYNSLPTYLNDTYDQYISSVAEDPTTGRGNYTPTLEFLIYTPVSSISHSVRIVNVAPLDPPRCSDFDSIKQFPVSYDASSDGHDTIGTSGGSSGWVASVEGGGLTCSTSSNGRGITISGLDNSGFGCSMRFSSNSTKPKNTCGTASNPSDYVVTAIRIAVKGNNSVFADIEAIGDSKLSYVGDNSTPSDGPDSYTGVSRSIPDGGDNTISAKFAPPCNYDGGRAYVYWKDADSRDDPNGGKQVKYYLYDDTTGRLIDSDDAGNGGTIYRTSFVPSKKHKYHISFSPVRKRDSINHTFANTIKIWPPFDSAATEATCPNDNTGDSTCTTWSKDITEHSIWKISVFSVGSEPVIHSPDNSALYNGVTPPYPSGDGGHSDAATSQWAKFKNLPGPAVYDETPSHDYTLTHNMPQPSSSGWYIFTEHWLHESNGNWQYFYDALPYQANCYAATCTITIDGNLPEGSSNVRAGSYNWGATAYVNNTGRQPLQMAGDTVPAKTNNYPVDIDTPQAPTSQGGYADFVGATATAAPWGPSYNVASCAGSVNVYQHFKLKPTADIDSTTDDQDPTKVVFNTHIAQATTQEDNDNIPYPYTGGISTSTHSKLYYNGGGTPVVNVLNTAIYGDADYTKITYTNTNTIRAGDKYCPVMSIDISTGWYGPGGPILTSSADSDSGCLTVVNKPFFKVYGSGACAGSGELSSWNNNTGTYPFGAGAQMAALATGKITGFGSGQKYQGTSSADLSFANRGTAADGTTIVINQDDYDPSLGGKFGTSDCATDIEASSATEQRPNKYEIPGDTIGPNTNKSVYVDGDVYIGDNITYSGSPWTQDTIPSYVLKARGNIYISNNVKQLDGVYSAGGTIYTCADPANHFKPMPKDNLFACNNQLVVHGSFSAKKVNLMRTYGSLRDEKLQTATPAVDPTYTSPTTNTFCFGENDAGKNNCVSRGYSNCVFTYEGAVPSNYNGSWANTPWGSGWWFDDYLCVTPASGIKLAWTDGVNWYYDNGNPSKVIGSNCAYWSSHGGTGYDATGSNGVWSDNKLCISGGSGKTIYFSGTDVSRQMTTNPTYSTKCLVKLYDGADAITGGSSRGAYLCENQTMTDPGSPAVPIINTAPTCNNAGAQAPINRAVAGWPASYRTCAAEVFDFSPQLYLSKPSIQKPSNGALQFDAITSLPPVL